MVGCSGVGRSVGDPKKRNKSRYVKKKYLGQTSIKPCFWVLCGLGVQWLGVQWFGCSVVWVFGGLGGNVVWV